MGVTDWTDSIKQRCTYSVQSLILYFYYLPPVVYTVSDQCLMVIRVRFNCPKWNNRSYRKIINTSSGKNSIRFLTHYNNDLHSIACHHHTRSTKRKWLKLWRTTHSWLVLNWWNSKRRLIFIPRNSLYIYWSRVPFSYFDIKYAM